MVRYEDLLADPAPALSAAMTVLDQTKVDIQRIEATVKKFSFESQTGRRAGKENRQSFLRSGQAGDWKNYFSLEALDVFLHYCRPQLRAAGYDTDAVPTNSLQR